MDGSNFSITLPPSVSLISSPGNSPGIPRPLQALPPGISLLRTPTPSPLSGRPVPPGISIIKAPSPKRPIRPAPPIAPNRPMIHPNSIDQNGFFVPEGSIPPNEFLHPGPSMPSGVTVMKMPPQSLPSPGFMMKPMVEKPPKPQKRKYVKKAKKTTQLQRKN